MTDNPYIQKVTAGMSEYEDYVRDQYLKNPQQLEMQDAPAMWDGYFSAIGFHIDPETGRPRYLPKYDPKWRVTFFPFLDEYWTRAGIVHIEDKELSKISLGTLRHRIYATLQEADKRNELTRLIASDRVKNLRAILDRSV